jgi:hypothetical protein
VLAAHSTSKDSLGSGSTLSLRLLDVRWQTGCVTMRITAERRADGVYVAAGIELIEPENRMLAPGQVPGQTVRVGDGLAWQTIKRLRDATGCHVVRRPMLKACACSAIFVGDPVALNCPDCARKVALVQRRAANQRFRAKRRPPLGEHCRDRRNDHPWRRASARLFNRTSPAPG